MARNILGVSVLVLTVILCSCSSWFREEPSFEITRENVVEIKELPPKDAYGFQRLDAEVKEQRVRRNQTLVLILKSLEVEPEVIREIESESKLTFRANQLRYNQKYITYHNTEGQAYRMILHQNPIDYIVLDWEESVVVEKRAKPVEIRVAEISGEITSSLYESLKNQNRSTLIGNKLSEIYAWQIDFFRLQRGDRYKVIYEQKVVDGKPYGVGQILAAEFLHAGETHSAFFHETAETRGYYNAEGKSIKKALLKAPFTYSQRVSSGFSHNRFHPVLKRRMPHYGVDYAAPLGTPVISVGDGEVLEARYRGANGNIVKIKHNATYTTAYLHLNGFAKGIKKGRRVKQGQVIGYVGRTGRVTGVHLDYRIYRNNVPVNPLKITLPPSKSLEGERLAYFHVAISEYLQQLKTMEADFLISEATF
ncbi:MAG: peptidoglycan DD-metalloendopeptidase family protein [Bacteroidota bacterium]